MKPGTYTVSSGYGMRWGSMHAGLDFACPVGTPIYAPADGFVVQGKDRAQGSVTGFGSWIWLDCQASVGEDFIFGHVNHPQIMVKSGDRVKEGDLIGHSGNEGESTGPHVHFEVWGSAGKLGGVHQDPANYLRGAKTVGGSNSGGSPSSKQPIFGVDVSAHQDGMSLKRAKDDGVKFAIVRLCDGTYLDTSFRSHLSDANGAGLLVSTYWFVRAPSEGTTLSQQVDIIDRQMAGRRDLGVWLDVEAINSSGEYTLTGSLVAQAANELKRRGYHVCGVYSGRWYWENMPGGEPSMSGRGHLWVSNYGTSNTQGEYKSIYRGNNDPAWDYPLGDRKPDILQYGSRGRVAGWDVDVNAYRGSMEELAEMFHPGTSTNRKAEEVAKRIKSLVNPDKEFSEEFLMGLIDRTTWENRVLLAELFRSLGMDAQKVVDEAIAADIKAWKDKK